MIELGGSFSCVGENDGGLCGILRKIQLERGGKKLNTKMVEQAMCVKVT